MQGEELPARSRTAPAEGQGGGADLGDTSEAALVAAVTRGDRQALARLYDLHASIMLALGVRILGDRTAAEDVLHDVFLEAWHRAADFDPSRGSVRAWLVTRMRSRALDRRASAARQARLAEDAGREPGQGLGMAQLDGADQAGMPLDSARIRQQISSMPEELHTLLELAYFDGLSSSEIATRLGIPTGTVKSRMARALQTLREQLAAPSDRGNS